MPANGSGHLPKEKAVNHVLKVAAIAIVAVALAKRVPVLNQIV